MAVAVSMQDSGLGSATIDGRGRVPSTGAAVFLHPHLLRPTPIGPLFIIGHHTPPGNPGRPAGRLERPPSGKDDSCADAPGWEQWWAGSPHSAEDGMGWNAGWGDGGVEAHIELSSRGQDAQQCPY